MLDKIAGLSHFQIDLLVTGLLLQGVIVAAVPEEIILLSLGTLWAHQRVGFLEAMLACQLGLLPANATMVFVGKKLGRRVLTQKPFCWIVRDDVLQLAMNWLHKFGAKMVFVTRFTPFIRGPVYFAVGISKMTVGRFIQVDALASFIHVPLVLFLGSLIGRCFNSIDDVYRDIVLFMGVSFAVALVALFVDAIKKKSMARAPSSQ